MLPEWQRRGVGTAVLRGVIADAVTLPFIGKALEDGRFPGDETVDKSAVTMLDELLRWTKALSVLRTPMSR